MTLRTARVSSGNTSETAGRSSTPSVKLAALEHQQQAAGTDVYPHVPAIVSQSLTTTGTLLTLSFPSNAGVKPECNVAFPCSPKAGRCFVGEAGLSAGLTSPGRS
jgi:hypothetical protein